MTKHTKEAIERMKTDLGRNPTAMDMTRIMGGEPSMWGRIVKTDIIPNGEYRTKLQCLKENGIKNFWNNLGKQKEYIRKEVK
jgi:hypothetical protein